MAELFWDKLTGLLGFNSNQNNGQSEPEDPMAVSDSGVIRGRGIMSEIKNMPPYRDYWPEQQAMKDRLEKKIPNVQPGDSMKDTQYDRSQAFATGLLFRQMNPDTPRPIVSLLGNAYESVQAINNSGGWSEQQRNADAWRDIGHNEASYDFWDALQTRQPGVSFTPDQIDELGIDYGQGLLSNNVTINQAKQPKPQWKQDWESAKTQMLNKNPFAIENPAGVMKEIANQFVAEGPSALVGGLWDVAGILADPYEQNKPADEALLPTMDAAGQWGRKKFEEKFGPIPELSNQDFAVAMVGSMAAPTRGKAKTASLLGGVQETGFYSPLERAVGDLTQQKGTGNQMLAMIQKQAGVKPEEVQWTGLGDFLAGKPSVTKSEIEDYLLNNRVELKEVSLESVNPYPYKTGDEWQAAVSAAERRRDWDEVERLHNAWEAEQGHGPAGTPKFERYSTPGGSNYRELLMTMPEREPRNLNDIAQEMFGKRFSDLGDSEANKVVTAEQSQKRAENYRSGHYDQPNILAHTRVKDYEQDGQKILHVDEVQSDWHQAGRKQGYASQKEVGYIDAQIKRLSEKRSDLADDNEIMLSSTQDQGVVFADRTMEIDGDYPVLAIVDKYGNFYPGENMRADKLEKIQKYANIRKELYKLREKRFAIASGVPDAPFKKNWHELMTRRILQEAADKGYSRVTFTTGRTQADRYDLRKSIEEIHYSGSNLTAYDKQGNAVIQQTGIREADLPDLIGKEAAEKLLNQPKQGTLRSLVGQELEVGGEGMKGFYDNMMVKAFNKEGKKFGVKVEPYKLRAGREVSWEEWMAQEHPNVRPMDIIGTPREAQLDAEYEAFLKNGGGEQVWSMEIPPEMRAKKKAEGSPMFAAAPFGLLGAGAMTPDKDAQAAMIAENIRQTPLSAFDLNRKPQAEMRAPRYGLLADIADAFEAGSRNDLLGSGESAARVANALAYGQRPGVLDTIVGSFEAIDPITWASLFGAMSKGR